MQLIEILLPITDQDAFRRIASDLERRLAEKFGGVTAFRRSPGEGLWDSGLNLIRDNIVVVEVMADTVDREWWGALRTELETCLGQDEIVIRSHTVERI